MHVYGLLNKEKEREEISKGIYKEVNTVNKTTEDELSEKNLVNDNQIDYGYDIYNDFDGYDEENNNIEEYGHFVELVRSNEMMRESLVNIKNIDKAKINLNKADNFTSKEEMKKFVNHINEFENELQELKNKVYINFNLEIKNNNNIKSQTQREKNANKYK